MGLGFRVYLGSRVWGLGTILLILIAHIIGILTISILVIVIITKVFDHVAIDRASVPGVWVLGFL